MQHNILEDNVIASLKKTDPKRFKTDASGGLYFDVRNLDLPPVAGLELGRLDHFAKILRGLIFATVEAGQSGHPGGSSSKVEQFLALVLGGVIAFDPADPKNPGRDRLVWSAGHCTPLLYSGLAFIYEIMRRKGRQFSEAVTHSVFPEDLIRFRHTDGPQGHAESYYPLCDFGTGPSGHGLSAAGGLAILHKSCGLNTKIWVFMGDAESEEGITYESRNILSSAGADNLVVSLDYNHFGIDGDVGEVISTPILNHWLGLGWNVIEVNGHSILELVYAYKLAAKGFANKLPTVVLAHTVKGKYYGKKADTAASHGSALSHEEYVKAVKDLGLNIPGEHGKPMNDIAAIFQNVDSGDEYYTEWCLQNIAQKIKPEAELTEKMRAALSARPFEDYTKITRPQKLPAELIFEQGKDVSTRKAARAFFKWAMSQTAFFYAGAADLSGSVLTDEAEQVYGLINKDNPLGRGLRFGIAEQNMAMMSTALTTDILPGGYKPAAVFGTYAVFTNIYANCVRLTLVNNHANPEHKGFFVALASHDGIETGEDGPTHQGQFWMSLYSAFPGIKVYKPLDASETIEMLFYAFSKGEPIVLALSRPDVPVIRREGAVPAAISAINGAYVFRPHAGNGKKKITLAVCGSLILKNVLQILPDLDAGGFDVKILAVTSPQLFAELRRTSPHKAQAIFNDSERHTTIALHNGWTGFMYPFILPANYESRVIGADKFYKSGKIDEVYNMAELNAEAIKNKIINNAKLF